MSKYYILENKKAIPCSSIYKWAAWLETHLTDRIVAQTEFNDVLVSTVFLGIDHNFYKKEKPILFETLVFNDSWNDYMQILPRYTTWEEAEKGHQEMVEKIKKNKKPPAQNKQGVDD